MTSALSHFQQEIIEEAWKNQHIFLVTSALGSDMILHMEGVFICANSVIIAASQGKQVGSSMLHQTLFIWK